MPILQPQGTAGWTYGGAGGQYAKSMPALPIQQEEDFNAENLLNQQYQQQLDQIEQEVKNAQQTATSDAQYKMNTLQRKYQIERREIESLRIPADKKREKLLGLNTKYELAATTIRGKIQPDLDSLQMQRQQAMQQAQIGLQNKLQELSYIERNGQEWGIDPKFIEARKLQVLGISVPTAWLKEQNPQERLVELAVTIAALEGQAETAKGEERKSILSQIQALHQERREVMSRLIPGVAGPAKTASKLTEAAAGAGAGRKPGTLAEGMVREKRKALKIDTTQFRGFAPIVKSKQEKKTIESTPAELRAQGTKEAYEKGKRLGYWD